MRNLKYFSAVLAGALLFGGVGQAKAGSITTYSDRSAFQTALAGPYTVETFTDSYHFPISTGVLNSSTNLAVSSGGPILPGDIQPGVTYSTAVGSSYFFNIDAGGGYVGGFLDGFSQSFPNYLTTTFTGPVVGFGFDTNTLMGSSFSIDIQFSSGPDYTSNSTVSGDGFFGFVSSGQDIVSAQILGSGSFFAFALDNFTYDGNPTSVVPEPGSLTVFGIGVASIVGLSWMKRRKA